MPSKVKRSCRAPGCPELTEGLFCDLHKDHGRERRESAVERGYGREWRRARAAYLCANPFCAMCITDRKLTLATVVDHIIPHRGDDALFWDESNWQPLCKRCHDKKTGHGR